MRIRFFGAAQEVTGSLLVLEVPAGRLVVDCGLVQGRRSEARRRNRELPPEAVAADAVLLTHAHIDHSGSLPTLVKLGYGGSIYATPATRDLCAYMLRDAASIQRADAEYLNRKRLRDPETLGDEPIEPLYDEDDAIAALERFVSMPYHHTFEPLAGVRATFLDAGHILGSASIVLDVDGPSGTRRIVVSGDLGRAGLPILRDPERPTGPIDYVVMESTYGNRVHGSVADMHDELTTVVGATVARGGKVIVPAFAVGRTQELLYSLSLLHRAGRLPLLPVFIDSPLATAVTGVFRLHPECFDAETRAFVDRHGEAFSFPGVRFVADREESIRLNDWQGPAMIISASGMCEAGRVLHHLKNHVEDPRNTILVVGFMAKHTLGRRIAERQRRIRLLGTERDLRAEVVVLDSFSAHADRNGLLEYAASCGSAVRALFLVHGEPDQQQPFRLALEGRGLRVHTPARGEVYDLT